MGSSKRRARDRQQTITKCCFLMGTGLSTGTRRRGIWDSGHLVKNLNGLLTFKLWNQPTSLLRGGRN